MTLAEMTLAIEGMSCNHCVNRVTKALQAVPGARVKSVVVGQAVVEAAAETAEAVEIEKSLLSALDHAGYPAHVAR
jgi:copper chaperone CopZ